MTSTLVSRREGRKIFCGYNSHKGSRKKTVFFSGPATKWGGGLAFPLKKENRLFKTFLSFDIFSYQDTK